MEMMGRKKKNIRWNTMGILAGGFLGVILLGGIFLWMPFSNRQPIEFMDALFTSVSAVCVTGLVTITPAAQFTVVGQMILLVLIQIGGLGVIACVTAFFLLLRRKITLKERIVIQETYNMDKFGSSCARGSFWDFRGGRCRRGALRYSVHTRIWNHKGYLVFGFPCSFRLL